MEITYRISDEGIIEFNLQARKPYGLDDYKKRVVVELGQDLPISSGGCPMGYQSTYIYWDPIGKRWIGFHFCRWRENSASYEEEIHGPYLIEDIEPPSGQPVADLDGQSLVENKFKRYPIVNDDIVYGNE